MTRDELVSGLVHMCETLMTGEDEAEVDASFAPIYTFHRTDGREWDYPGLKA